MNETYQLIALDVDGTLLTDAHVLNPRVKAAVRSAAAGGAEIVLCTGRGFISALPVLEELGLQGTMITHNGASVIDSATRAVLHETAIVDREAEPYLAELRERGIHYDMNTSFELYVHGLDERSKVMYEHFRALPLVRRAEEGLPARTVKLCAFAPKDVLDEVEREWRQRPGRLQWIRSGDRFVDIQHPGASKGQALEKLAALRGYPRERILAIGNYYNDIGMLAFAGHGVAMANSPGEVKAEADEITLSNNEDGVAVVLERLVTG